VGEKQKGRRRAAGVAVKRECRKTQDTRAFVAVELGDRDGRKGVEKKGSEVASWFRD
jgi:hypothetical protein